MKRTATLEMLEAYAARITNKQANSLYEHKCHKPYCKVLNESAERPFELFVDAYNCEKAGYTSIDEVEEAIIEKFGTDIDIRTAETGLMLSTSDTELYGELWSFVNDELEIDVVPSREWQMAD